MTARSLDQERRDYEITVSLFEGDPPDSWFQRGYACRVHEELKERGYVTLALRLETVLRRNPMKGDFQ